MSASATDLRIRALRPAKPLASSTHALGSLVEDERRPDGGLERALTVFLAGAECPFTCSFCDLWRYTLDGPTPPGALPRQLSTVLESSDVALAGLDRLKLYNASNFFDRRAVPADDVGTLATLSAPFAGVTVESHASTVGRMTLEFAALLHGRLEVAIGLETIHPVAASQLNKRLDLDRFERAAGLLSGNDIDLRVFALLGAPHIPREESVEWAVRTVEHAARNGAAVVSIIPVRGGNGEMERLASLGLFAPPSLNELERALDACLHLASTVVTADLWDVERLPACEACRAPRVERLRRINLTGHAEPRVECAECAT